MTEVSDRNEVSSPGDPIIRGPKERRILESLLYRNYQETKVVAPEDPKVLETQDKRAVFTESSSQCNRSLIVG